MYTQVQVQCTLTLVVFMKKINFISVTFDQDEHIIKSQAVQSLNNHPDQTICSLGQNYSLFYILSKIIRACLPK